MSCPAPTAVYQSDNIADVSHFLKLAANHLMKRFVRSLIMRRIVLLFLAFVIRDSCRATITPQVDKRVEIMSIVARLAGYDEYNDNAAAEYAAAIKAYFDRYTTDSLIRFAKEIRGQSGISFDAVMSMAVNLEQKGRRFSLQSNWQEDLDPRWTAGTAKRFVVLLGKFYSHSHADDFFKQQAPYYEKATKAFAEVLNGFNQSWYFSYYGVKPRDEFNVVISCANGGSNYGPSVTNRDGSKKVFAIMGSWSFDAKQDPVFPQDAYLPTLIHEFNHSFINPSIEALTGNISLHNSMQILLDTMQTEMTSQAYKKWETVLIESLVRASVIRYMMTQKSTPVENTENEMMDQLNRGFLWTRDLVALLGVYESDRSKYPAFTDFYPVIIDFFRRTATNISQIKADHEMKLPKVVSIEPIGNNTESVDTSITQLIIRFNGPMIGKGYSFTTGQLGKEADPVVGVVGYNNENTALRVNVKLKPGKEYEMVLTGRSFINTRGYRLKQYVIRFKTAGSDTVNNTRSNVQ
ncbi:MAG: hypothetical protein DI535_13175 [Citrobacter freundii]|nr:MAG: hypothetical protein DI535_13175 [Citrobacter freundii]